LPRLRIHTFAGFVVAAALGVSACGSAGDGSGGSGGGAAGTTQAPAAQPQARVIATGLQVPWGVAFLPGGDALVSERTTGRIVRIPAAGGPAQPVMQVPGVDTNAGEGGLLGLAISPNYTQDQMVYAYFTSAQDNRVVRFTLGGTPAPVLTGLDRNTIHDGGRIAFGPDGMLYVGTGDAGNGPVAQDPESLNGKILRLRPDGGVPDDNPFRGSPVWSVGHRNVQGLAWDGARRLWEVELGQDRVDEVNLIRPARNYGWPRVEGRGDTNGGRYTNPLVTWPTSEASPSGAAIADGALYVGALRGERLWRVPLDGARAGRPQGLLEGRFGRLRTVVRAPDGALWVTTSNRDGRGAPEGDDDRIVRVQLSR
jgi:glucose/arabinose dehydrogenase